VTSCRWVWPAHLGLWVGVLLTSSTLWLPRAATRAGCAADLSSRQYLLGMVWSTSTSIVQIDLL
jgi:hypothetical protein